MYNPEPLVSVLIPVYNVAEYVDKALMSIVRQSYRNLEIIVIDDCSSDGTIDIIKKISKFDDRIIVLRNDQNRGIARTLNLGLSKAHGIFIARMDGDDISEYDRIETKVKFLMENPSYSLVGCSVLSIDVNDNVLGKSKFYGDQNIIDATLKYVSPVSHIWVAKKAVYDFLDGYRELDGAEDYDFLLRMKSNGLKFTNIPDYFGYRVRLGREGNTIHSFGIYQLRLHEHIYKLYKQRIEEGKDSFDLGYLLSLKQVGTYWKRIHSISSESLFRAIQSQKDGKWLLFVMFMMMALLSPYQMQYLIRRLKYKFVLNRFNL